MKMAEFLIHIIPTAIFSFDEAVTASIAVGLHCLISLVAPADADFSTLIAHHSATVQR